MPVLDDEDMDQHKSGVNNFQFSAAKISTLGASEYTLVGLASDVSGSTHGFRKEIEACVKSTIESCQQSPRADNLMVRLLTFSHKIEEVHGFKQLGDCHLAQYDGSITNAPSGGTALYDASVDLIASLTTYGKTLIQNDYSVNGIFVAITDGYDESSTLTVNNVKQALDNVMASESLESLVSILIGVNVTNPVIGQKLKDFKDQAGFTQYVEVNDATPKTMAKLAGFISKSISSQSQSLGTKQASQPITF